MSAALAELLPLLVHVQANLDGDLGLAALARFARRSPSHLHRRFTAAVGETPGRYVTRLRVERAAFRLHLHDVKLIDLALECGFHNHETFIRAFRRTFGCPPGHYRSALRRTAAARTARGRAPAPDGPRGFALGPTRVVQLRPLQLAFLRHVGPYEAVPDTLFDELEAWAERRRLPGPRVWLGLGHDAPGATPAHRLRFDAALVVPEPFTPRGRVGHQVLPGGDFAVTTHVGPFSSLPEAWATVLPRALALPGYRLLGLPAVERYHSARVTARLRLDQTDLYLPVVAGR